MAHKKRQRPFKPFKSHAFQGGPPPLSKPRETPTRVYEEMRIEWDAVPADLDEEALAELDETIPSLGRKKKPEAVEYAALQGLALAELHAIAEAEGHSDLRGKKRREVVFEIARARLEKRVPLIAQGVIEIVGEDKGFLRTHHASYLGTHEDVFVPPSLVRAFGLRTGMTVRGPLRPVREDERYFCVRSIESIDFHDPEFAATRTPFKELVPLYPERRIVLEGAGDNPLEMRIVDLVTPIGRGQRGLIVAPPRTGKTVLLQQIANSIMSNAPDAHLVILLLDERPEEVTDFQRRISGDRREVVSSTFDEPAARHLKVAEMVMYKARCLVEAGEDVVILLDSITRLARAANTEAPSNGKLLSGGIEATAMQMPKQFFGSARNIEGGGSLTILGTALIETGSKMDEVIFEEFKGTGNMELVLERRLSDRRIFPAIDINRSGTRKEELLFTAQELERIWVLRKVLNELDPVEAMEMLTQKMRRTKVNGEFLMTIGG